MNHRLLSILSRTGAGLALALAAIAGWAQQAVDPPDRVAWLAYAQGAPSVAYAGSASWQPAEANRPLTSGDQITTLDGARAELFSGSTALRLDGRTVLEFSRLDDAAIQLKLTEGSLALRIRTLFPDERYEVDTPNLAFVPNQPGDYRIDVDPARGLTRVSVLGGSGTAYGENAESRTLVAGLQTSFGTRALAQAGPQTTLARDDFDAWVASRDQGLEQSQATRFVSPEITGYQQLDTYGDWGSDTTYG
ncbi:MAG TPA: chromosome partitioning protein ParA, partial [Burkholderiaceae bacterium]